MKVVFAKLTNHDDVFGLLAGESKNTYIFRDLMVVEERVNSATGSTVIVLVNYSKFHNKEKGENDVEINKDHVIFCTEVTGEYERYYHISRTYYTKYIEGNMISEIKKVTDAMEEVLFSPPSKPTETTLQSTANNTIH